MMMFKQPTSFIKREMVEMLLMVLFSLQMLLTEELVKSRLWLVLVLLAKELLQQFLAGPTKITPIQSLRVRDAMFLVRFVYGLNLHSYISKAGRLIWRVLL